LIRIPGSRPRAALSASALLFFALAILIAVPAGAQSSTPKKTSSASKPKSSAAAVTEHTPTKTYGSSSAPITMEVFSDYQCPACRQYFEATLRPLIGDYVAQGKVYLIHRDFPLPVHAYGLEAARWLNAAARLGKFGDGESALYDNQPSWSVSGDIRKFMADILTPAQLTRAEQLVSACRSTTTTCVIDQSINADKGMGDRLPVTQTPTSVITFRGQKFPISGYVTYPVLKQFLDQMLAQ